MWIYCVSNNQMKCGIKQWFERNSSDPLIVNKEMQPCAFHMGEEEGLFVGDRGPIKDDASMVKEGLCA